MFEMKIENGFPAGPASKESACSAGDPSLIPESGDPLENNMTTHSSILAWRIPQIEERSGLRYPGPQRV